MSKSVDVIALEVQKMPIVPSILPREHLSVTFDNEYANVHKFDNPIGN